MNPTVSIIVITYNSGRTILETLDSIYNLTYRNIELIISDDCSKDDTIEICRQWLLTNSERFTRTEIVTTEKNDGIPANCNRGIKASSGDWVKLIAGDDLFFPDAIEIIVNEINNDPGKTKLAFHGKVIEFQDDPNKLKLAKAWEDAEFHIFNQKETTPEEQFKILLRFCPVFAPTAIIHKSVFEKLGYYDERFKFWEDRPMWLKLTQNGIKLHYINANLVKYRRHAQSVQLNSNRTLLSRTVKSKDEGYKALILPYLPISERWLHKFTIFIRSMFFIVFNNKKNLLINILYKSLVIIPDWLLNQIKKRYSY